MQKLNIITYIDGFVAEVFDILWSHVKWRLTRHQKHCNAHRHKHRGQH